VTPGSRAVTSRPLAALACTCAALAFAAPAMGAFEFSGVPALPALAAVTINGKAQTLNATMTTFGVTDTRGTKSGWNLTAQGQSGVGKSAVFAQYCPKAKCGTASEGYVPSGRALAPGNLTLNSTGAKFLGGTGAAPTFPCSAGCSLNSASAVKVATAATGGAGEGTWKASGFSASSLSLAVASTMFALPSEEVYRVNVLWTLSTGP